MTKKPIYPGETPFERVGVDSPHQSYATPQWLFDRLDARFGFNLDVCANADNHKCERYFDEFQDGLEQSWGGAETVAWCNPPYGNEMPNWVKKAHDEHFENRVSVVMLIPARTCTLYWHRYVMKAHVWLMKRRIAFIHPVYGQHREAPFSPAIVIFKAGYDANLVGFDRNAEQSIWLKERQLKLSA